MNIPVVVQTDLGDNPTLAAQIPGDSISASVLTRPEYAQVAQRLLEKNPAHPPLASECAVSVSARRAGAIQRRLCALTVAYSGAHKVNHQPQKQRYPHRCTYQQPERLAQESPVFALRGRACPG